METGAPNRGEPPAAARDVMVLARPDEAGAGRAGPPSRCGAVC